MKRPPNPESPPVTPPRGRRLGEILIDAGVITPEALASALETQARAPGPKPKLGSLIVNAGDASEEDIARCLSQQMDIPFVDLDLVAPDPEAVRLVPRPVARRNALVPIRRTGETLVIAMADPTNVVAVDDVRLRSGVNKVSVVVATAGAVRDAEARFYAMDIETEDLLNRLGVATEVEVLHDAPGADGEGALKDLAEIERSAADAPVIRLANAILADAVRARATDIHIEPQAAGVKVRYRVDGLLREVMDLPKNVQAPVISRIKIMSGMDISERRKPQDGRSTLTVEARSIDTRVSSIPTMSGEKLVIRLLPKGERAVPLSEIGMEQDQLRLLESHLAMPQGLIVFTGPTGAGKTSTMYAGLSHIQSDERNIVTLEDPIEYEISGLNQVQIDEKSGITFASGLRTILRQDPDIVMVGEIRDQETAETVLQASLTGHLVVSSLHTKDAASAITRLVDLGVEPFLIASALTMVVAQRLVRRVCGNCGVQVAASERDAALLGVPEAALGDARLQQGEGCASCGYTGYRGRTGIFEVLPVTKDMRTLITERASDAVIVQTARRAGIRGLREAGLIKVKDGVTTSEEVARVSQVEQDDVPRCPRCRHAIDPTFLACPYCNADLGAGKCPSCNKQVEPEWTVCPYCRTHLLRAMPESRAERPRMLVVDDDPSLTALAEVMFSDEYEVLIAMNGEEGLRRATLERPDVILLDLHLPDMLGTEIATRLRGAAATSLIPLIMVTGDDSKEIEGLRAGVDDYVVKPFDEEALRVRLNNVLKRSSVRRVISLPG